MIMPESTRIKQRSDMIRNYEERIQSKELVMLYNSKLKLFLGKLKSRWNGPYTV